MALPLRRHPGDAYPIVTPALSAVLGETGSMPNHPWISCAIRFLGLSLENLQ